jgi:hypothetical protein
MRWASHVASIEERDRERDICTQGFDGEPDRKRPVGRPKHRLENNIKIDMEEFDCGLD